MQFLLALTVFGVAAADLPIQRTAPLLVRAVIDGDTIDVSAFGRVRLLGIDAPEIGHGFDTAAPFGGEARAALASLVLHRWVRLEQEGPRVDAYNRHLAYVVREDGLFVNAELLRRGLARVSARLPFSRLAELRRAEAEARTFRRGMWGATPAAPTDTYRTVAPKRKPRYSAPSASGSSKARRKKKKS